MKLNTMQNTRTSGNTPHISLICALVFSLSSLGLCAFANSQVLDGPDPAQMEDAPHLGYRAVENGLRIPSDIEMGSESKI